MKTINKWIGTILTNEIPFRAYIYQVWVWGKEKELTSVLRLLLDDGVRKGKRELTSMIIILTFRHGLADKLTKHNI